VDAVNGEVENLKKRVQELEIQVKVLQSNNIQGVQVHEHN